MPFTLFYTWQFDCCFPYCCFRGATNLTPIYILSCLQTKHSKKKKQEEQAWNWKVVLYRKCSQYKAKHKYCNFQWPKHDKGWRIYYIIPLKEPPSFWGKIMNHVRLASVSDAVAVRILNLYNCKMKRSGVIILCCYFWRSHGPAFTTAANELIMTCNE